MPKKWKRIKTNKMRWQGDIDYEKKVIRINPKKSKKKSSVIDTIRHEEMHRLHPKMWENRIRKKTRKWVKKAAPKQKMKLYNRYHK